MTKQHWLVKSEPSAYAWADLLRDGETDWTGVRNYQARAHLAAMRVGDLVFFYESVSTKAILGIAEVTQPAFPDATATGADAAREPLSESSGKQALSSGMGCEAKTAGVAIATARSFNEAGRPPTQMHATRGVAQGLPKQNWIAVKLRAVRALPKPVTLAQIKTDPTLAGIPLIRQSRLSVMPLDAAVFEKIAQLGDA